MKKEIYAEKIQEGKCPKCSKDLFVKGGLVLDNEVEGQAKTAVECPSCKWVGDKIYDISFKYYRDDLPARKAFLIS